MSDQEQRPDAALATNAQTGVGGIPRLLEGEIPQKDMGLINRAVRERWPMKYRTRKKLVQRMDEILESGETGEIIDAARVLISADAINLRAEQGPDKQVVNVNVNTLGIIEQIVDADANDQTPPDAAALPQE